MRNCWCVAALLVSVFVSMMPIKAHGGETGNPAPAMSVSVATDAANKWASVLSRPDVAVLNDLLHDDYMHIHATAMVESKAQVVEALSTGARKYDPFKIEDAKVRIFGDTAIVTGKFNLKATMRDKVIERVNRFGMVVVNTPQGVKVASFQATSIPPDAK